MRFHASISDDESSDAAADAVIEAARDAMGNVDIAFVYFTAHHRAEAGEMLERLWLELDPQCIVGCSAEGVIGGEREIERSPGLSLLVAEMPGVNVHPFHIRADDWRELIVENPELLAERVGHGPATRAILGFGDPFTTPMNQLMPAFDKHCPGAPLIGGMASSAQGPGENLLLHNDVTHDDGMVGVSLSGPITVDTLVSQGCRPIGKPMIVTKGKGNVIETLGGRAPLGQLRELVAAMSPADQQLLTNGLMIGKAINEYREKFGRGDFLVRNLMGVDEKSGAIAVAGDVRVGQTVQFHVRDAASADEDLRLLLEAQQARGTTAGALLFSCNGRGTRMFEEPCHDIAASRQLLPATPVAGFFAAGELGPVGGQNFIHGHTASFALFREAAEAKT